MITQNRYDLGDMSYQGLSTDTKPTFAPVNSLFLELDTKTLYYCSKSGGESEEVVYEGEFTERGGNPFLYEGKLDADSIEVTFDGVKYTCEKRIEQFPVLEGDPKDGIVYGAIKNDDEVDWSEYPFRIIDRGLGNVFCFYQTEGTHSLSITSLVTTEAEWVEYGEAPSGGDSGITGNLVDGLTISPSAWSVDRNLASVSVPYCAISSGEAYTLRMGADIVNATGVLNERDRSVSLSYFDDDFVITSKLSDQTTQIVVATDKIDITHDISVSLTYSTLS